MKWYVAPFLLLIMAMSASADEAAPVFNAGGVTVKESEIRYLLGNTAEALRERIVESPEERQAFIEKLLAQKRLAEMADNVVGEVGSKDYWELQYDLIRVRQAFTIAKFKEGLTVPDMSVIAREEYMARKNDIAVVPEKRKVAHILLTCEPGCDREAKKAQLKDFSASIAEGAKFADLAKQYSEDFASARNGGRLGTAIAKDDGNIAFAFRKASFALENPGDLSPPVETLFGYHLIVLEEIEPSYTVPFERLRDQIVQLLEREWTNEQVALFRGQQMDTKGIDMDAFNAVIDSFQ
ncbi:PPIC-type PPIASE domain protein [Luminiphilus syltensis NOR5-1B]|uniref:peptidylprolyl isomerase n=1 Tax=Luminiphilus syltensis NOR5-1B TaxID=565045 RepID=B8KWZ4_9GAMM|nr:peptidylprolyl isomerase [Luminiphilus syltensis]EED36989.1 PPIC-type PPIASE domain protein [Luminiphilus syltensis NOR5-1B]